MARTFEIDACLLLTTEEREVVEGVEAMGGQNGMIPFAIKISDGFSGCAFAFAFGLVSG